MSTSSTIEGIVATVNGAAPGKNVVILGAVHGTEPCGPAAFERILPSLTLKAGSVTFVIGNPRAWEQKVRFTQANLNRMFRPDTVFSDEVKGTYEYQRSRELMTVLDTADAILDIHSSESSESIPFVICGERSRELAQAMPFPIISWGWDAIEPGGTDDYVESTGKIGLGIECGYNNDPVAGERAEAAIIRFLSLLGCIDAPAWEPSSQQRIKATYAHMAVTGFEPAVLVPDFTRVVKGTYIGRDGDREMYAPTDGYLIFVRRRTTGGQEAYIFAEDA